VSLKEAIRGAQNAIRRLAGENVIYQRGMATVTVRAVRGQTVFRLPDENGIEIRIAMGDYLVEAEKLILGGMAVQPQLGDRIVQMDGAVYEVLGPGGGEPEWEWSGPPGLTFRIHTKEVRSG